MDVAPGATMANLFTDRSRSMFDAPILLTRCLARCLLVLALVQLAGCSTVARTSVQLDSSGNPTGLASPAHKSALALPAPDTWQHYQLPGKQPTEFSFIRVDGRDAVAALANASASMLLHRMRIEPDNLGQIRFSWKVPQLIEQADMALRDADDSPVRIILVFDGDRSRFSLKNSMLSELLHAISGEPLPYATLMYVWCNTRPFGSVIVNPRTDRIRKIVAESGTKGLSHWLDYERNIRADFEQAFGELPGALVGIGIMTDTDNTRTSIRAWYGQLDLTAAP